MPAPTDKICTYRSDRESGHSCPIYGISPSRLIPKPIPGVNPCDANCRKIKIDF